MTTMVNEEVQTQGITAKATSGGAFPARSSSDAVVLTDQIRDALKKGLHQDVPFGLLRLARRESQPKGSKAFFNARNKKGLDPKSIAQMSDWIKEAGLLKALTVRPILEGGEVVYQIIAGERRYRAIAQLLQENGLVYDQETDSMRPVGEVFATVRCLVSRNTTDDRAIAISWMENDSAVALSDGETIAICEYLVEVMEWSRDKICKELKKSPGWLSQTLSFRTKLDTATFEDLCDGKLSRSFCLHLTDFPVDQRADLKRRALEVAVERHDEDIEVAKADVVEAKINLEAAQEKADNAPRARAAQAVKKVEKAEQKVAEAEAKVVQVEAAKVVPLQSDLDQSAFESGVTTAGTKGLSTKQIQDHWVEGLENMLASDDRVRDKSTNRVYPRRDLKLALAVAQAIGDGSRDILGALAKVYHEQGYWGTGSGDAFLAYREKLAASKSRLKGSIKREVEAEFDAEEEGIDIDALGDD